MFDAEESCAKKPFKFVNVVASLLGFLPMLERYWSETDKLHHSTSAMYRFEKKLKMLKPLIRELSKDKLGSLGRKVKESFELLCAKQKVNLDNPSDQHMLEESEAFDQWTRTTDLEEGFAKQRSKLHWLKVGDKNNKAFHRAIKVREAKNTIREIQGPNGECYTKIEDIKSEAERYFKAFLNFEPEDYEGITTDRLEELLDFRCSELERNGLIKEVTEEEVRTVLFRMASDKSPGPDGYTTEFYKAAWQIIGKDFTVAVQSFFVKGFLPKAINSTILALIPKMDTATVMKDYRPISCCNVIYKVISKIIANRLKTVLPNYIVPNQSAFVKDRLLMENVLLATELVKEYHNVKLPSRCALKMDISKAFDTVQWSFLRNVLTVLRIPEKFIGSCSASPLLLFSSNQWRISRVFSK